MSVLNESSSKVSVHNARAFDDWSRRVDKGTSEIVLRFFTFLRTWSHFEMLVLWANTRKNDLYKLQGILTGSILYSVSVNIFISH